MKKGMKASDILKKAAKHVCMHSPCDGYHTAGCVAIFHAAGLYHPAGYKNDFLRKKAQKYFEFFKPRNASSLWFGEVNNEKNRQRRITALLLASAIAKSEGN